MHIAIASGKGGTGKTTLAANLSSFLSSNDKEVVLVDLDVEEPDSSIFLKGEIISKQNKYRAVPKWDKNKCISCGKCKTLCNFNAIANLPDSVLIFSELCHSCYACSELCPTQALPMIKMKIGELTQIRINKRLSLVEGKLEIGQESAVSLIKQTKDFVNSNFHDNDIVKIIDSPPGTSCSVIEAVKDVDFVVLITEPTAFGLHDLKLAVATIKELDKDFAVIINRFGIGDKGVENYCQENNILIIGEIPNMRKAAYLYSAGKLIYKEIPEIKEELYKIWKNINELIICK